MRIKICGITRSQDAVQAMELGAWSLGFIAYPKSPRYIEASQVRAILQDVHKAGFKPAHAVAVFVNATAGEIEQYRVESGIDTVQLHGDETPDFCENLPPICIWKAFRLRTAEQLQELPAFEPWVEAFLFDAAVPGQYGGTGHTTDWGLVASIKSHRPVILSGGLNPENLSAAAGAVPAFAFDLSSGVESAPGIKDSQKLQQLFAKRSGSHDAKS